MFTYREFPNPPRLVEIDRMSSIAQGLPWRALLALPEYVTRDPAIPWFDLPVAAAELLGGWRKTQRVLRTRVWAPAWDAKFVAKFFADRISKKAPSLSGRPGLTKNLYDTTFFNPPGPRRHNNRKHYDIVFFVGNCVSGSPRVCLLDLGKHGGGKLNASDLQERLSLVRLLILQTANPNYLEGALKLAEEIAAHAGPAVLVVRSEDAPILNDYFYHLFGAILQNKPLDEAAAIPESVEGRKLEARLFCGAGGTNLLLLHPWINQLTRDLEHTQQECRKSEATLLQLQERTFSHLHQSQRATLLSQIEGEVGVHRTVAGRLSKLSANLSAFRGRSWQQKTKDILAVVNLASQVSAVGKELSFHREGRNPITGARIEINRPRYAHLEDEFLEMSSRAPRVLNVAFAEAKHGGRTLGPRDPLLAGQEYDLLLDVGPRWNKFTSLVTGTAEFPEDALEPDSNGYLVDVLLVSGDFSPHMVSGQIWVPRSTGRSFPVVKGERASVPGSVVLHLRAPEFPKGSDSDIIIVRGRLSLYFAGNLLQSALVRVGVTQTVKTRLEHDNSVDLDFVLTSGFQKVASLFDRRALQFTPDDPPWQGHPVALNLTMNDDGTGGHRIIVKCGLDSTALQGTPPPPAWAPYNPVDGSSTLESARRALLACFWRRDGEGNVLEQNGLGTDNGKSKDLFVNDLKALAKLGSNLFNIITSQVSVEGDTMDPLDWTIALRSTLAQAAVIQVARITKAEYAFPWALVYDIPMPGPKYVLCKVLSEWDDNGVRGNPVDRKACPYENTPGHLENVVCPYGFWGLKHIIEQPASVLKEINGKIELADAVNKVSSRDSVSLSIGLTGDPNLNQAAIKDHIATVKALPNVRFVTQMPAEDVISVRSALEAPGLVYFLCHGKFDSREKQPYLGIGAPDDKLHQLFPAMVEDWARTQQLPNLSAWREIHPLVFINGCQTCELKPEQTLQFVTAFTYARASGILGTETSIKLPLAIPIAEFLLKEIVTGKKIGQSLRQMRWQLANKGNLLGLAYTLYALADVHVDRPLS